MKHNVNIPNASRRSFTYWFSLEPVEAVKGLHNLEVRSQYRDASNPAHLERQLQVNVEAVDLELLHQWLSEYLSALRNS